MRRSLSASSRVGPQSPLKCERPSAAPERAKLLRAALHYSLLQSPTLRLRQIKIAGFKSFADPVVIELRDPLIGIVGPNGCGKSNIIDAVRWVLGEGRIGELRGSSSMSELIFAGSTGRAPLGRASVELVLDNSDHQVKGPWGQYEELSVRRVVTKDGASAYYINHQQVRRRDVQEIFMGTGLGARSYAIISQGMIASFIRAKPEELRVYLEEAAGVSLYKERRRETENHLKTTRENLERAADLQAVRAEEISRLRAEAETASRWQELNRRKLEGESLWYFLQYEEARKASDAARATIAKIENDIAAKRRELETLEGATDGFIEAERTADAAHRNASDAFRESEKELARLEGEMNTLVERRRSAERGLADAQAALKEKTALVEELKLRIEETDKKTERLSAELEELDEQNASRDEALEAAEGVEEDARMRAESAANQLARARTEVEVAEAGLKSARERTAEIEKRLSRLAVNADDESARPDEEKLAELAEALAEAREIQEETATQREEAAAAAEEARERAQTANEAYFAALSQVKALRARLETLEAVQKKALESDNLTEWLESQGLDGLPEFIHEIDVDDKWVTALEAVLEHRARAFLLRDLRSASGFAADKNRPPARLSFAAPAAASPAPHPDWKAPRLRAEIRTKNLAAASAADAWTLNVGTAESLEAALAARESIPEGCAIVTPRGDIVTAATVTFWAAEDPRLALLSREREIAELTHQVEALDDATAKADDLRTAQQKSEAAARAKAEALSRDAVEAERRAAKLMLEEREAKSAWEAWQRREADLKRSREEMLEESRAAEERTEAALAMVESKTESLEAAQKRAGDAATVHNRIHDKLINLRRDAAESIHRQAMKKLEAQQAREAKVEAERRLAAAKADIERELKRIAEWNAVLQAQEDEKLKSGTAELLEKNAKLEKALADALAALEAARTKREDHQKHLKALGDSILPLTEEVSRLRVEAEQKAGLLGQFTGRLEELGADWTAMAALAQERGVKANAVRNEVTRLMNEIAALGPVNHAALAHLQAAEEAVKLAEAQMADLRQAIETLEAAIRRIDSETRARMRETFEKVNVEFNETFRGLFGGGRAALRMEGDEILSAGVEVTAQPPGKRNQTVRLLSGGEQALTATALVFAMFKLNPAPFCLLDEVDAPLDEANQGRLARLCTEMSANTQFLIITHHRVTMEYANALIGVTMKEAGVSRVVAVDIAEAVEYAQQDAEEDAKKTTGGTAAP